MNKAAKYSRPLDFNAWFNKGQAKTTLYYFPLSVWNGATNPWPASIGAGTTSVFTRNFYASTINIGDTNYGETANVGNVARIEDNQFFRELASSSLISSPSNRDFTQAGWV